jgi:hypothetical protein
MTLRIMIALMALACALSPLAVRAQEDAAQPAADSAVQESETVAAAETTEPSAAGLGMTQGTFAIILVREAKAERLFAGEVTAAGAADKLAGLGLAPEKGWRVMAELTRPDLESAYLRLTQTMAQKDGGEEGEADPPVDLSAMTIAELMEKITQAVKDAIHIMTAERQPISPSRPLWR